MSGPTEASVDQAALNYLNRFDSSVKNLRRVLRRQLRRKQERNAEAQATASELDELDELIDRVLVRFEGSGLLDDRRLAKNLGDQLRRRGNSARAIRMKLIRKGVAEEHVDEVFQAENQERVETLIDPEQVAARAYARRRRLGAFRRTETSREQLRKDLTALARQGFSFRTAQLALQPEEEEEEEQS